MAQVRTRLIDARATMRDAASMTNQALPALSEALTLHAIGPGEWRVLADPRYEAALGMFGGWTAAVLLRAVLDDPSTQGTPSALTVHYVKRVPPGSELTLRTRNVGGTRSLGFWQVELFLPGETQPADFATVLMTNRRPSDALTTPVMPVVPSDPTTLPVFHPPGSFGQNTPMRAISGYAPFTPGDTRSLAWARESSGRALDYLQLAYLSDAYAPRAFFIKGEPRPSPTITLSVYFHATAAELSELGDDYVLNEAIGTRAEHSTSGQQARLWSRSGKLLATTEQLCWFK